MALLNHLHGESGVGQCLGGTSALVAPALLNVICLLPLCLQVPGAVLVHEAKEE